MKEIRMKVVKGRGRGRKEHFHSLNSSTTLPLKEFGRK